MGDEQSAHMCSLVSSLFRTNWDFSQIVILPTKCQNATLIFSVEVNTRSILGDVHIYM